MKRKITTLLMLLLGTAFWSAQAQTTYTWTGTNGPWNEAIRWSPEGVPGADDIVHISSGTVTLSGNTTIAGLHISNLGVITGNADLTITGSMKWSANNYETFRGSGTVTVAPGATLSMTGTSRDFRTSNTRSFVNAGTAVWPGSGRWGGPGQFINEGDLELSHDAEQSTHFCFSSTPDAVVNAKDGIIRRTGSGELVVYCPFANHGRIEVHSGTLRMRDFNGNGGTDSGAYDIARGAILIFDGNRTLTEAASVAGEGIVRTGANSTGTTAINGSISVPVIELVGGVGLALNADTSVDTLRLGIPTFSAPRRGGSGTLTVRHEMTWENGYLSGTGTTIVAEDASLSIHVSTMYAGIQDEHRLINEGTATWTGTHRFGNSGESIFINRGNLEIATEWTGTYGTVFFAGTFTNEGIFIVASDTTMRFSSGFNNHGLVDVRSGTLELSGFNWIGGTDSGRYILSEGARLEFTGGVRTLTETASIEGSGTVVINDGADWREVVNRATWRPGASPGMLTIETDYPAEESVLEIELGGYEPGADHDVLVVEGRARLSGTLRLDVMDGFAPVAGDFFTVVSAAEVAGTFDAVESRAGYTFGVGYTDSTVVVTVAGTVCEDGLQTDEHTIALYKFDEPSPGVSFDGSGNGNDAVDHGTTVVDGRFCNARRFDGQSDRIDMDAAREALQGSTEWTIEYVARSEDGSQVPALINHSCGNGWWFGAGAGSISYGIKTTGVGGNCPWNGGITNTTATLDTLWHYYALAWDGDSLRVYRDGNVLAGRSTPGTFEQNQSSRFGAWLGYNDYGSEHYSGLADEVRVSDVARGKDEIHQLAIDLGFVPALSAEDKLKPSTLTLHAPYPNPFTDRITIEFDLPDAGPVRLAVFDVLGRRIALLVDEALPTGRHTVIYQAGSVAPGMYLMRMEADHVSQTRPIILMR